jgi:hypothetical protein
MLQHEPSPVLTGLQPCKGSSSYGRLQTRLFSHGTFPQSYGEDGQHGPAFQRVSALIAPACNGLNARISRKKSKEASEERPGERGRRPLIVVAAAGAVTFATGSTRPQGPFPMPPIRPLSPLLLALFVAIILVAAVGKAQQAAAAANAIVVFLPSRLASCPLRVLRQRAGCSSSPPLVALRVLLSLLPLGLRLRLALVRCRWRDAGER